MQVRDLSETSFSRDFEELCDVLPLLSRSVLFHPVTAAARKQTPPNPKASNPDDHDIPHSVISAPRARGGLRVVARGKGGTLRRMEVYSQAGC